MSAQHTPGPWKAVPDSGSESFAFEIANERMDGVALVYDYGTPSEANARLIAAAPDLLEALEATLVPLMRLGDFIGNEDAGGVSGLGPFDRCAIISLVRTAIEKAEGREP